MTYTVVRTLNVGDVGHPAFFVYPNEREDAGHCEGTARRAFEPTISPPRGRGDARQR